MAKSKTGGTRAYIRGRVGNDVYSVGMTANGKKQQVVRSLAETVKNPQTLAQMRGRMIMSTVMQAVSALRPIIDHSFDNVPTGQPNVSEFIRRNYQLVKVDVAQNPSGGNSFGLNQYQEKGAKQGAYVISDGQALLPDAITLAAASGMVSIAVGENIVTVGDLKTILGLSSDEYLTLVGITAAGAAAYCRFRVNPEIQDDTAISSENVSSIFLIEGNTQPAFAKTATAITISISTIANCCAVIVSRYANAQYIHNSAVLSAPVNPAWDADTALPTYPVGEEMFLNGGDLYGGAERNGAGGSAISSYTANLLGGGTAKLVNVTRHATAAVMDGQTPVLAAGTYYFAVDDQNREYPIYNNGEQSRAYGAVLANPTGTLQTGENGAWIASAYTAGHTTVLDAVLAGNGAEAYDMALAQWLISKGVPANCWFTPTD